MSKSREIKSFYESAIDNADNLRIGIRDVLSKHNDLVLLINEIDVFETYEESVGKLRDELSLTRGMLDVFTEKYKIALMLSTRYLHSMSDTSLPDIDVIYLTNPNLVKDDTSSFAYDDNVISSQELFTTHLTKLRQNLWEEIKNVKERANTDILSLENLSKSLQSCIDCIDYGKDRTLSIISTTVDDIIDGDNGLKKIEEFVLLSLGGTISYYMCRYDELNDALNLLLTKVPEI